MDAWPAKFTTMTASEVEVRPCEVLVVALELPGFPVSLVDERAVEGQKDLPLAVPQPRVLGNRLWDPDRPTLRVDHHVAEWDQQGAGLTAEFVLEAYGHRRTRDRLAVNPLRYRRLGHLQPAGKLPLGDPGIGDGFPERLSELEALDGVRGRLAHGVLRRQACLNGSNGVEPTQLFSDTCHTDSFYLSSVVTAETLRRTLLVNGDGEVAMARYESISPAERSLRARLAAYAQHGHS